MLCEHYVVPGTLAKIAQRSVCQLNELHHGHIFGHAFQVATRCKCSTAMYIVGNSRVKLKFSVVTAYKKEGAAES